MDTNGFSDPYAVVYYGDKELFRTKARPYLYVDREPSCRGSARVCTGLLPP